MAVSRLAKLLIVTHKKDQCRLLEALRKKSVIELNPYVPGDNKAIPADFSRNTSDIKKAVSILDNHKDKLAKKIAAKAGKFVLKKSDYEQIIQMDDIESVAEQIIDIEDELKRGEDRVSDISKDIKNLKNWRFYEGRLEDIGSSSLYTIRLGTIRYREKDRSRIFSSFAKNNISYEDLSKSGDSHNCIVAYHNDYRTEAEECLLKTSFSDADLHGHKGTIKENILLLEKKLEYENIKIGGLKNQIKEEIRKNELNLIVHLDNLENNMYIDHVLETSFSTENASFYTGWVREEDKPKVFSLMEKYTNSKVFLVEPEKDEEIPVILDNKSVFAPFEVIINLYGVPKYFEIDPTPYVSVFFALFFGLTLTDAGYGIIFLLISIFLFFRMKGSKKFALLIFLLGLFTIGAGIVFNGWFGDLPSYLGGEELFTKMAILGDPIKSNSGALNFFRLALFLGVIQVLFGMFIKFFDNIKRKNMQVAFLDVLPWIVIVVCLVIILLSGDIAVNMQLVSAPLFPAWVPRVLVWPLIPAALVIILFSGRDQKSWGFRLFMGFLNLTIVNGITSYMGDFLSYIRLMALGLVTAGIGVAINKIAFLTLNIPYIGVGVLIIGLIFGHAFNIGINVLGGFVHSLRLQYVEFFSKFYEGGGRPFRQLREEHKYITIID